MVDTIRIGEDDIVKGFFFLDETKEEGKVKFADLPRELAVKMSWSQPKADLIFRHWNATHANDVKTHDGRVRATVRKLQDTTGWKGSS